jgi:XTP/dITP diphosphohydrolase
MGRKPGRLIDNNQVFILKQDSIGRQLEGPISGRRIPEELFRVDRGLDRRSKGQSLRRNSCPTLIHVDNARHDEFPRLGFRDSPAKLFRQPIGQDLIKRLVNVSACHADFEFSVCHGAVYFPSSSVMARSILIATNNAHKVEEFREAFAQFGAAPIELVTPQTLGLVLDPDETAETYLDNARIKARAFHRLVGNRPDLWVMADDSGLEVDALDGRPGIHSARFHKNAPNHDGCAALLHALKDVPEIRRSARFHAVVVLMEPGGEEHVFEGICEGAIGSEKRGTGGFGFDPVFRVTGDTRHLAELSSEEKHRISHRGKATEQIAAFLNSIP